MLVAVTVVTFLTFHLLRPESFAGDGRPLLAQLGDYLWRAAHGDLGRSWDPRLGDNDDVATLVWRGLPGDAALVAGGLLAGGVLGIAAGAYCAARRETAGARTLQAGALLLLCAPVYWVGLMLILVFGPGIGPLGVSLFALPGTYRPLTEDPAAWLHALVVPWLVIGAPIGAMALRMTRAAMGDVLEEDFMRTAAAKGLRERTIIRRHAVPAAAAPAVALVGANTALGDERDPHRAGLRHPGGVPHEHAGDGQGRLPAAAGDRHRGRAARGDGELRRRRDPRVAGPADPRVRRYRSPPGLEER